MNVYLGKTTKLTKIVEKLSLHPEGLNSLAETKPSCVVGPYHSSSPGDRRVFDVEATLKRLGNDRQLFVDLLDFFLEDYPILIDRLRQGLQDRDLAEAALAAHSLKGLAANFDALNVVDAAAVIEKAAHDGDLQAATQAIPTLERDISRLRDMLIEYRDRP
jgi:HPt (histidine-containing phosphotransfer) domain-containing protein